MSACIDCVRRTPWERDEGDATALLKEVGNALLNLTEAQQGSAVLLKSEKKLPFRSSGQPGAG